MNLHVHPVSCVFLCITRIYIYHVRICDFSEINGMGLDQHFYDQFPLRLDVGHSVIMKTYSLVSYMYTVVLFIIMTISHVCVWLIFNC